VAIDIERALKTEGWMTELELTYLAETASKSHAIAEIGSWMGRSTCALAANTNGWVVAVDTWKGSEEHVPMLADKPEGWLYRQFCANIDGLPVLPAMESSMAAARHYQSMNSRFDMIFIDANHSYESVKADILAWTPLLADGGILCGHDFDRVYWPGIVKAVEELVPNFRVVPNTTIWTTEEA
jgi:predicted O-methyltransferase YrrM